MSQKETHKKRHTKRDTQKETHQKTYTCHKKRHTKRDTQKETHKKRHSKRDTQKETHKGVAEQQSHAYKYSKSDMEMLERDLNMCGGTYKGAKEPNKYVKRDL